MKILFIINNLSVGGAEGVFINESKALVNLGFDVEVYTLYPKNFKNLYDLGGYWNLIKKIKSEKITHIYSTLDDANFAAKIVRIFVKFKLFCREANETQDKSLKFKIADILLNFLVTKLVMVAESVKKSYLSYDPYHESKMEVLCNGVLIPDIMVSREIGEPIKLLAVGSFTNKKGFLDLVSIINEYVVPKYDNFILEIVGDGPLFEQVVLEIKNLKLENKIRCLGAMDKKTLAEKYLNSDIFVLTSKKEGCPNVLLEAMAHGVAPICFEVGAVPEIIENNISGSVIKKGDRQAFGQAINDLLNNPSKIRMVGNNARERIMANFAFNDHIEELKEVLELR